MATEGMTVAVTGPTGTFGMGLIPLLQADNQISRVIGIARRPFDPAEHGWTKMDYIRGDVREPESLEEAFSGAEVVVHLAFMITGAASRETIRAINVDGTLNAFRAAASAGATRFVYASSVAAYGFHRDNPVGMTEEWPARPDAHLFYAREKAQIEALLSLTRSLERALEPRRARTAGRTRAPVPQPCRPKEPGRRPRSRRLGAPITVGPHAGRCRKVSYRTRESIRTRMGLRGGSGAGSDASSAVQSRSGALQTRYPETCVLPARPWPTEPP
jgi:3-beta hydroxysteroid dehydrogenase/isomerase family